MIQTNMAANGLSEFMSPIAAQVTKSVKSAYEIVISPEYHRNRYPSDYDWEKYIDRINHCITLLEIAITVSRKWGGNDDEDIERYKYLEALQEKAIVSRSYEWKYVDLRDKNLLNIYAKKPNLFPVQSENRVYIAHKKLADVAIAARRKELDKYHAKIKEINTAREQKRFDAYWTEHSEEKASLEAEKKDLDSKIAVFKKKIEAIPGKAEIDNADERIKKLTEEKYALGLFRGKEKKALQEQIDQANTEKKGIQDRMDAAKKEIEAKISPLQNRVNAISYELTKAR